MMEPDGMEPDGDDGAGWGGWRCWSRMGLMEPDREAPSLV